MDTVFILGYLLGYMFIPLTLNLNAIYNRFVQIVETSIVYTKVMFRKIK